MAEFDYKQTPFRKTLTDAEYDLAVGRTSASACQPTAPRKCVVNNPALYAPYGSAKPGPKCLKCQTNTLGVCDRHRDIKPEDAPGFYPELL